MSKEELIEIIKAEQINAEQLRQLERLIDDYPWFGLPRFLRLKAKHQAGEIAEPAEVSRAVVFSSDRSYLYRWIRGEAGTLHGVDRENGSELEFFADDDLESGLGEDSVGDGDDEGFDEGFDEGSGTDDDDAHERALPEKEETEMEEPEIDEPEAIPVFHPMDDDEELEEEGIAADSVEQMVKSEGGEERSEGSEEDEAVEQAAVSGAAERAPGRRSAAERFQEVSRKSTSGAANHSTSLIEQFLNSDPGVIKADKKTSLEGDVSVGSIQEDDSFITDTLAKIYVKQGLHAKAIYAYERLSLKYPEKSAYFAAQIEKIKNISNI